MKTSKTQRRNSIFKRKNKKNLEVPIKTFKQKIKYMNINNINIKIRACQCTLSLGYNEPCVSLTLRHTCPKL